MQIKEISHDWAYALTPRTVTTHLIMHHLAETKAEIGSIHAYHLSKGWAGFAYHYYVRKDGSILRGRPENMRGGHTTNWNWCAIGICFEGNFEKEEMPQAQLEAGQWLVADIRSRYPEIIAGRHCEYGATACPGKNFPYIYIVDPLDEGEPEELNNEIVPAWGVEGFEWAKTRGFIRGDGSGLFRPNDPDSRVELAVILKRYTEHYGLE